MRRVLGIRNILARLMSMGEMRYRKVRLQSEIRPNGHPFGSKSIEKWKIQSSILILI